MSGDESVGRKRELQVRVRKGYSQAPEVGCPMCVFQKARLGLLWSVGGLFSAVSRWHQRAEAYLGEVCSAPVSPWLG